MRKLIAQQWVTVDNIAAEEDEYLRPGQGLLAVRRRAGQVRREAQQPHQVRRLVDAG
jgi:hypothetical protein